MFGFERRLVVRGFLVLGVLAFTALLAGVNNYFQRDLKELVAVGQPIEAIIYNKNCSNAGVIYYGFRLEGSEHVGSGNACAASCINALVGEKIQVTYAPQNPDNSMCGSAEQATSRFNGNYYAIMFVGLGLLLAAFWGTRRQAA